MKVTTGKEELGQKRAQVYPHHTWLVFSRYVPNSEGMDLPEPGTWCEGEKLRVAVAKEDEGKANRLGLSYGFGGGWVWARNNDFLTLD